jgi:hypothetical protein
MFFMGMDVFDWNVYHSWVMEILVLLRGWSFEADAIYWAC